MLNVLAAGFLILSLFCDLLYLGGAEAGLWRPLALYTMVGGCAAALAAVAPRVVRLDPAHRPVHLVVAALYGLSIWLRMGDPAPMTFAISLSILAMAVLAISSWLSADGKRVAM